MRGIGFLVVLGMSWLALGRAHAQVREGDVRLYLDSGLFSWAKEVTEVEAAGVTQKSETTGTTSGLLVGGGVGLGYALSRYLVPELYASLQNAKIETEEGDGITFRQWELRPCVEVPLLPEERFVPYLMGGMTLGRAVSKADGDADITMFGLGPALGAGAHAFLTDHASLDLGLAFRGTFYVQNDLEDDALGGVDLKTKQYALLLTLGASFWL